MPHLPAPYFLLQIDHPSALLILFGLARTLLHPAAFSHGDEEDDDGEGEQRGGGPRAATMHELQWVLALLLRVDDLLDGNDVSRLRQLVRALSLSEEGGQEEEMGERKAMLWMVRCVAAGIWGQRDLWDDGA